MARNGPPPKNLNKSWDRPASPSPPKKKGFIPEPEEPKQEKKDGLFESVVLAWALGSWFNNG